ncbi:MAG TPA: hypothetical protein PKE20_10935, partial [Promineifilum sp.]|nr:hypothetical protein [Promineifilum sp.]
FLSFAVVVVLLSAIVAFYFSARAAERALAEQMINRVDATAARLGALQSDLTAALAQDGAADDSPTPARPARREMLGRIQANSLFDSVRLVDETGAIVTGTPAESEPTPLSPDEYALAGAALTNGRAQWGATDPANAGHMLVAIPAEMAEGDVVALLAVISQETTAAIIDELSSSGAQGGGLIVDEASQMKFGELALALPGLAPDGRLVLAGDDLQLPPIVQGSYPAR